MTKQTKKSQKTQQKTKKHLFFGIGIIVLAILVVVSVLIYFAGLSIKSGGESERKQRIEAIYASIPVPEQAYFYEEDIFGDKRPYEHDAGRSTSSFKRFVLAKNVDETFAYFDTLIKDAGYKFHEDPYPGSVQLQRHYKSDKGEYIRLSVSSKLRDDAASSEILMKGEFSEDFFKIDPNAGPSRVTIKVNLDDNNE